MTAKPTASLEFRSYSGDYRAHSHDYHQLILPGSGELELEVGTRSGLIDGTHGVIIVAGERHAYRGVGDNSLLVVDVPHAATSELSGAARLWDQAQRDPYFLVDPGLEHYRRFLAQEMRRGASAPGRCQYWATLLLLSLADRVARPPTALPARIRRAVEYIERHHGRPVTAREVAAAANLSVSHLHALFRATTGRSVREALTEVRLNRALELLATTENSIAAIAVEVGYADQSALTRSLQRYRGVTPAAYRRQIRNRTSPSESSSVTKIS